MPLTQPEVDDVGKKLKPLVFEDLIRIAEYDGEPVAFMVTLPDFNEALKPLKGSLLPFGWAKLLWRLKVAGVTSARVPLMGVRRDIGLGMFGRVLPLFLVEALRREALALGIRRIEMSWVLEDNLPMRHMAESFGATAYKTYRIYGKAL